MVWPAFPSPGLETRQTLLYSMICIGCCFEQGGTNSAAFAHLDAIEAASRETGGSSQASAKRYLRHVFLKDASNKTGSQISNHATEWRLKR